MAQTQAHPSGGAFYLPQRLIVQLPITDDSPEGGAVQMEPGWYTSDNTDPRVLTNPIVRGLIPQDSAAAAALQAQADMVRKIANGEATPSDLDKLQQEQAQAKAEAQKAAVEAWNEKAQAAADKGAVFSDPHPDPAVVLSKALTAQTPQYIASGGMQSKIEPPVNAPAIQPAVRPQVTPPAHRPSA